VRPRAIEIASSLETTPRRDAARPDRSWWSTQMLFQTEGASKKWTARAFALAREYYRFGSAAVTLDGTRLEESGGIVDRGMPGFMARLRRAENLEALESTVSVYYLGVYLCEFSFEASWAQVSRPSVAWFSGRREFRTTASSRSGGRFRARACGSAGATVWIRSTGRRPI